MTSTDHQPSIFSGHTPLERARQVVGALAATAVQRDRSAGLPDLEVRLLRAAGLLDLVVPRHYGGQGGTWPEALEVVRALSHDSGSLGQLYGNHLGLLIAPHLSGSAAQQAFYYRGTAEHQWFWANALNTRDPRLRLTQTGAGEFRLNGVKGFGTGVAVGDQRLFSAVPADGGDPVTFVLPQDREGIHAQEDWDSFGQRRTASGTVNFDGVQLGPEEILSGSSSEQAFSTFSGVISQATKTFIYLGIAESALVSARDYLCTQARPWLTSGVTQASHDPYVLRQYAELWVALQGALALARHAATTVQAAWRQEWALTAAERGAAAVDVFAAKVSATQAGLQITSRLFELLGPRATTTELGFDRFWRDLRTFTLHDPVDYKLKEIGDQLLNDTWPAVTQYS
ncbi:acyl-CoA dehydrogenase family protein [Deinococcus sp. HMF7604]|uniref:acyl-CoA dehydrogenase family protein n=1 Tax=Deinococcus betulae TaxID=2873312 RepID=UPI001CCDD3A4|nr:acyl-CoA dehydrogenase family protein [Deinococcus betulae]MBZ9750235.1 acyl-CoA dehydrogenase family protein [Deinococcus betulae]